MNITTTTTKFPNGSSVTQQRWVIPETPIFNPENFSGWGVMVPRGFEVSKVYEVKPPIAQGCYYKYTVHIVPQNNPKCKGAVKVIEGDHRSGLPPFPAYSSPIPKINYTVADFVFRKEDSDTWDIFAVNRLNVAETKMWIETDAINKTTGERGRHDFYVTFAPVE